jgi:predicted nucleic acid-binding protein
MVKPIDPAKYDRVKTLLIEGKSFSEIRTLIQQEFGSAISFTTLGELKKTIPIPAKDGQFPTKVKMDMKTMIQLFYKALDIPAFVKLISDADSEAVSRLEVL